MIRKLSDPISPLERNPQSPKGWKNRESDCIGLRIVLVDSSLELQKGSDTVKYHHVSFPISIGVNKRGGFGCDWRCCDEGRSEKHGGIFCGSPTMETEDLSGYRIADFLSFCYLCRKRLDGKDIYMYRGEKAFCSVECRYQQIVSDEFHENCGSEALRSSDASRSSYTDDRLFFTGVAAA